MYKTERAYLEPRLVNNAEKIGVYYTAQNKNDIKVPQREPTKPTPNPATPPKTNQGVRIHEKQTLPGKTKTRQNTRHTQQKREKKKRGNSRKKKTKEEKHENDLLLLLFFCPTHLIQEPLELKRQLLSVEFRVFLHPPYLRDEPVIANVAGETK